MASAMIGSVAGRKCSAFLLLGAALFSCDRNIAFSDSIGDASISSQVYALQLTSRAKSEKKEQKTSSSSSSRKSKKRKDSSRKKSSGGDAARGTSGTSKRSTRRNGGAGAAHMPMPVSSDGYDRSVTVVEPPNSTDPVKKVLSDSVYRRAHEDKDTGNNHVIRFSGNLYDVWDVAGYGNCGIIAFANQIQKKYYWTNEARDNAFRRQIVENVIANCPRSADGTTLDWGAYQGIHDVALVGEYPSDEFIPGTDQRIPMIFNTPESYREYMSDSFKKRHITQIEIMAISRMYPQLEFQIYSYIAGTSDVTVRIWKAGREMGAPYRAGTDTVEHEIVRVYHRNGDHYCELVKPDGWTVENHHHHHHVPTGRNSARSGHHSSTTRQQHAAPAVPVAAPAVTAATAGGSATHPQPHRSGNHSSREACDADGYSKRMIEEAMAASLNCDVDGYSCNATEKAMAASRATAEEGDIDGFSCNATKKAMAASLATAEEEAATQRREQEEEASRREIERLQREEEERAQEQEEASRLAVLRLVQQEEAQQRAQQQENARREREQEAENRRAAQRLQRRAQQEENARLERERQEQEASILEAQRLQRKYERRAQRQAAQRSRQVEDDARLAREYAEYVSPSPVSASA